MNPTFTRAIAVFACLGAAALFMANARESELPISRTTFASFPMTMDGWQAVNDPPMEEEILAVLGVDDYLSRAYYKADGSAVSLYMGFYGSQRQGDTIHSPLNCLPGAGWEPLSEGRLVIPDVDGLGRAIEINRYVVQKGLDRQMVLYWYQSHDRVVASEYTSRLLLIGDAIRKFAHPDAVFTGGGMLSLIWIKVFWKVGPQVIGLFIGVMLGCALVLR